MSWLKQVFPHWALGEAVSTFSDAYGDGERCYARCERCAKDNGMFTFLQEDVYIGVLDENCTWEIEALFNCTLMGSSLLTNSQNPGF